MQWLNRAMLRLLIENILDRMVKEMVEWKKVRLGDIAKTNKRTYSAKENWDYVNYLDTGNIVTNTIAEMQHIDLTTEKLPSRAKRKVSYNSIIYSTVRPNQLHYGIIKEQPENFLVSTGFTVIDVDSGVANADFIYYVLTQYEVTEYLQSIGEQSVSAYPSIKPSDIENLQLDLPELTVQEKIVSILTSLDRKIKNNILINDNLEQQIQYVFNNMFPNIFKGSSDTLETIISFSNGKKRPEESGTIPVYGGNGILAYTRDNNSENCVIIGRVGAYCGNTYLCSGKCWVSDNAIQAKSKNTNSQLFIYYCLKNASLPSKHIGSGQPLMTQGILNSIQCVVPDENEVEQFIIHCTPMQQLIDLNIEENDRLSELRDSLLPKLMTGEIDISDIEL